VTFEGFEPDPSIKAEPIQNGRGRQQQSRKPAGNKRPGNRNNQGSSNARSNNQGGSANRSRRRSQNAA